MLLELAFLLTKDTVTKSPFIDDMPDWIIVGFTFIAVIISIISLIFARKSYKLSKNIEDKNNPQISLYLIDSGIVKKEKKYIYIFKLIISNLSRFNNSIKLVELRINYELDSLKNSIIFTHNGDYLNQLFDQRHEKIPISIDPGTSENFIAVFEVSDEFRKQIQIKNYELIVTDTFNNKNIIKTSIICEVNSIE